MQVIPREMFFELVSKPDVVEAENAFSYDDFLQQTDKMRTEYSDVWYLYRDLRDTYLKKSCPPIKFCGEGSSRAAYAISGGKCLKVATEDRGVAQNKQELKICKGNKKYSCFPKFYEYDTKNYLSLLTDCCTETTDADFRKLYGLTCQGLMEMMKKFIDSGKPPKEAAKTVVLDYYDTGDGRAFEDMMQDLVRNIAKGSEPKFKVLNDLLQFYVDQGNDTELLFDDLEYSGNWGLHKVGSQIVPVVIDAGLSEDVYNVFYQ